MDYKNQKGSIMIEFCFIAFLLAFAWQKFSIVYEVELDKYKRQHRFPSWERKFK